MTGWGNEGPCCKRYYYWKYCRFCNDGKGRYRKSSTDPSIGFYPCHAYKQEKADGLHGMCRSHEALIRTVARLDENGKEVVEEKPCIWHQGSSMKARITGDVSKSTHANRIHEQQKAEAKKHDGELITEAIKDKECGENELGDCLC